MDNLPTLKAPFFMGQHYIAPARAHTHSGNKCLTVLKSFPKSPYQAQDVHIKVIR